VTSETRHDRKVRKIAAAYDGLGYLVRADIPGYDRPRPIRGKVPDVVAVRGKTTKVVEVETERAFAADKDQRCVFRDYAANKPRTKFRWTVARQ